MNNNVIEFPSQKEFIPYDELNEISEEITNKINKLQKMTETKCIHHEIAIYHYAGAEQKESAVVCRLCSKELYDTAGKGYKDVENYIKANIDTIEVLEDNTCEDLNERFHLKSDIMQVNLINALNYILPQIKDSEDKHNRFYYNLLNQLNCSLKNFGELQEDYVLIQKKEM